jgi:hypothetical protein
MNPYRNEKGLSQYNGTKHHRLEQYYASHSFIPERGHLCTTEPTRESHWFLHFRDAMKKTRYPDRDKSLSRR